MITLGSPSAARRWAFASAFTAAMVALAAGGNARADGEPVGLGARHQVVVSVEHLAGYVHTTSTIDGSSDFSTALWLLGNADWSNAVAGPSSGYVSPRAAFDVFVAEHLSLGTSALFSKAHNAVWHVILSPRLGVAYDLGRVWSVWGRFGFTYVHQDDEFPGAIPPSPTATVINLYALSADIPFVLRVAGRAFVSFAPTLDVGVGGSSRITTTFPSRVPQNLSVQQTSVGFQCAVGAYF